MRLRVSRRWLALMGVGTVLVGSGLVAYRWVNQPVTGSAVQSAATFAGPQPESELSLASPYFTTKVTGRLVARPQPKVVKPMLERHVFASEGQDGDQLAISIAQLPAGGLRQVPDVDLRMRNTQVYTQKRPVYAPTDALVFISEYATYEKTVFFARENHYAVIAVTGRANRANELDNIMKLVLTNWQWN